MYKYIIYVYIPGAEKQQVFHVREIRDISHTHSGPGLKTVMNQSYAGIGHLRSTNQKRRSSYDQPASGVVAMRAVSHARMATVLLRQDTRLVISVFTAQRYVSAV